MCVCVLVCVYLCMCVHTYVHVLGCAYVPYSCYGKDVVAPLTLYASSSLPT